MSEGVSEGVSSNVGRMAGRGGREDASAPPREGYATFADVIDDVYAALGDVHTVCTKQLKANRAELDRLQVEAAVIRKHLYAAEQREKAEAEAAAAAGEKEAAAAGEKQAAEAGAALPRPDKRARRTPTPPSPRRLDGDDGEKAAGAASPPADKRARRTPTAPDAEDKEKEAAAEAGEDGEKEKGDDGGNANS